MDATMKLYTYFRSSAAFRVRIALNVKGVRYESIPTHLMKQEQRAPEYLQINPQGLVPALVAEGAVLSQSLAIIEYLEERHPSPALLPQGAIQRAQVRSMALMIACEIHPLNNLRVLNYLRQHLQQNDDGIGVWYRHWIVEGFGALETQLREHSTQRRHCYGDSVSLADVYLLPQVFNARRFNVDVGAFPTIAAVAAHLETLPAFAAARPDAQPDAT